MNDVNRLECAALTCALVFAITEKSESKHKKAVKVAESLAADMSDADIEQCKAYALEFINNEGVTHG